VPIKVVEEWLNICGGCEVTILDIGEPLLDLLPELNFVHMPVLMDHKYFGQTGEKEEMDIPPHCSWLMCMLRRNTRPGEYDFS